MPTFDHHIHTSRHSPDSVIDPIDLVVRARAVGLDGIVITEHDKLWPAEELAELAGFAAESHGLKVYNGVEISAREGHFLVYGLADLDGVSPGVSLARLLKVARTQGAAVVAAHPYRWEQDFDAIAEQHGGSLDAVELVSNNVTPETRAMTSRLIDRMGLAATGSSDAHELGVVGCYFTEILSPVETFSDFIAALRSGGTRPRHAPEAILTSGPVP